MQLSVIYVVDLMIAEVVKILHHDLFQKVQISDQNVGLLANVVPANIKTSVYCII